MRRTYADKKDSAPGSLDRHDIRRKRKHIFRNKTVDDVLQYGKCLIGRIEYKLSFRPRFLEAPTFERGNIECDADSVEADNRPAGGV